MGVVPGGELGGVVVFCAAWSRGSLFRDGSRLRLLFCSVALSASLQVLGTYLDSVVNKKCKKHVNSAHSPEERVDSHHWTLGLTIQLKPKPNGVTGIETHVCSVYVHFLAHSIQVAFL